MAISLSVGVVSSSGNLGFRAGCLFPPFLCSSYCNLTLKKYLKKHVFGMLSCHPFSFFFCSLCPLA